MIKHFYLSDGTSIKVDGDNPLGKGGEGTVYALPNNQDILLKIYSKRALERMDSIEDKVLTMTRKTPSLQSYQGLTIIAWPQKAVYNKKKHFVGYLMHKVNAKNNLSHIITPGLQKKKFPSITWKDRVVIAINLALVMDQIHKNDSVIGDINTSDFFVYPQFEIGVVDTDSFQIEDESGKLFHCNVFTPDYTPPEVIRQQKKEKHFKRTPNNDNYGLAILIFQILMNGVHPFSARIAKTLDFDGNAINYCMEKELFPYHTNNAKIRPPRNAMPIQFLPKSIQNLFIRAFKPFKPKDSRPNADEWIMELRTLKDTLKQCRKDKTHYYPKHFKKCPHCLKEKVKNYDFLLKKLAGIEGNYTEYRDELNRPIFIKQQKPIMHSLSGQFYPTKKKHMIAKLYRESSIETMDLTSRGIKIEHSKLYKGLNDYLLKVKKHIYTDGRQIGVVYRHKTVFYPVKTFVKGSKIGKKSINEHTRLVIAKKIATLFKTLESLNVSIEYEQLYIDKHLKLIIPDMELLGSKESGLAPIRIKAAEIKPPEYYMHLKYLEYLQSQSESVSEEEKDDKAIKTDTEDSEKETDEEAFQFEKRDHHDLNTKESTPPMVETYDPFSKETLRFQLAVVLHKLMLFTHPFDGVFNTKKTPVEFFIEKNIYLHDEHDATKDISERSRVMEAYSKDIQKLFRDALKVEDATKIKRPSPDKWKKSLASYMKKTVRCQKNPRHFYHRSFVTCPICHENQKSDVEERRTFCISEKRTRFDYILNLNLTINKLILIAFLISLIVLLNLPESPGFLSQITTFDMNEKMDGFVDMMNLNGISSSLSSLFNSVKSFWNMIFGGVIHE